MIDLFDSGSAYTIRFPCPTHKHAIEMECRPNTVITVPRECPTCGIGLPDLYRSKMREILNVTRFQVQQVYEAGADIEILSA
jgi:hypothetical protein